MKQFNAKYWDEQYVNHKTAWDIGYASPPIVDYFNQIVDKELRILVPGAGNAWEVEYLWKHGFPNVYLLDYSQEAIKEFQERVPDFPHTHIIIEDFFQHQGTYDFIVEQTFFSSLLPSQRKDYATKIWDLLKLKGKLIGLLFNHHFSFDAPPFGGTIEEYEELFQFGFVFNKMEIAFNSIKPRKNRELFILLEKKRLAD